MKNPLTITNDMSLLYAPFRGLIAEVVENANKQILTADGKPKFEGVRRIGVFETYRSPARQLQLYKSGASPMRISNYHSVGLAADLVWYDENNRAHWDNPRKLIMAESRTIWDIIGHCARAEGLVWGGDWKSRDQVHIQCTLLQRAQWLARSRANLRALGYETA